MDYEKYLKTLIIGIALFFASVTSHLVHGQVFNEQAYKFVKVFEWINSNYVDSVNENKLIETAIVEMLKQLDPHSIYIPAEKVKRINEPLKGQFDGIGITYSILNDSVVVISTNEGCPARRIGIKPGDRIITIEDESITGENIVLSDIKKKLSGRRGTEVTLGIRRKGVVNNLSFTMEREPIPIPSIVSAYMISDDTGYIKLVRFSATTPDEFEKAFDNLKKQGMKNLIFDLQNNGGGYMRPAVKLADEFIEDNKLIVFTEGVNSPKEVKKATNNGVFEKGKLAILINEGSASASEILSGAVQDWDRGIVIGRRSFGKGLVQKPYRLNDGSVVRLTIARYYTPSGRSIQKPYVGGNSDYRNDIQNRLRNGELVNKDSIHFPDSLKFRTCAKNRIVYGGGGIMPDLFVPLDTTSNLSFYKKIDKNGTLYNFVLSHFDSNRLWFENKYEYFDVFDRTYRVSNFVLEELYKQALEKFKENDPYNFHVEALRKDFVKSKRDIATHFKAHIARMLWSENEYYAVINELNNVYLKAVDVMQHKSAYHEQLK